MQESNLTTEQASQLDTNIKSMVEAGATQEDVVSFVEDYKSKFSVKKKEVSSSSDTESPSPSQETPEVKTPEVKTPEVEDEKPVINNVADQIYLDNNGEAALKELQDARDAKSSDLGTIKESDNFEQESYTVQEQRGLENHVGDGVAAEVEIEGFDNEKMIELNNRLFQSGSLNEEEIKAIDQDFQRQRTGDLTFGEKANVYLNPFVKEDKYRKVTVQDRDEAVAARIIEKQSDFFKGLTPEEIPEFKSYMTKRNDKLSEEFVVAESFNQKIVDNILKPEGERLAHIETQIEALKNKGGDITQDDVDEYNHLVKRYTEGVEKLRPSLEQYEANRKTLSNNSDDLLSFESELDLVKRDYDQFKFLGLSPYNVGKGFQYLAENTVSFAGGLIADSMEQAIFGMGHMSTPMDKVQSMMDDYSIDISKRKSEHEEGIPLKRSFGNVKNASDFGEYFFSMIEEQIPILGTIALTGGAGLGIVAAGAGGDRYGSLMSSDNGASRGENMANSIMYAGGEYLGEKVTFGILKKYKAILKSKKMNPKSFREGIKRAAKSATRGLTTANQEGMSELYTKYIQGVADVIMFDDKKGVTSSPLEEYAAGFLLGGGIHVAAGAKGVATPLVHKAIGAYSNSKNKAKVLDNTKKIVEYENNLKQEGLDQGAKDYYTSKIKALNRANNEIINVSAKNINNLDPASFSKVAQINEKMRALQISGEKSKDADFQNSVREELKMLKHNKDLIINESVSKEYNNLTPKEKLVYVEQANRELLDANVLSEFTLTEEETTAKAVQLFNAEKAEEAKKENAKDAKIAAGLSKAPVAETTNDVEKNDISKESEDVLPTETVKKPTRTDDVKIKGAPKGTFINVGMKKNKSDEDVTEQYIKDALPEGVETLNSGIKSVKSEAGTENTLSLELSRPLTDAEMVDFLKATDQMAMPQISEGQGAMHGTKDWGDFNPEFFSMPDNKQLSETLADSKKAEINDNVAKAEERLMNALNSKFTKGVVDFDPNGKGSKDVELMSALIGYVQAKISQGAYSVKKLASELKARGFKIKDSQVKDIYKAAESEGKTTQTVEDANKIVKDLAESNTKEVIISKLKEAGFADHIIELAVDKGFVKSVISNTTNKVVSRASVGLVKAMDKIRVAYNEGGRNRAKQIRVATKEATDIIFKTIKGRANLNDVKSLISKVRDINDKNFDTKIKEIEETIEKITQRSIDQSYVNKTNKVIKTVRAQNKKGRYDVQDNPNLRAMITQITGLKANEVPKALRAKFVAVLSSIASYKRTGSQPLFDEVSDLYEGLVDTFITKTQIEESKALIEIENASDKQLAKEEKEAEDKAHYLNLVNELMSEGYNKESFDEFDRGQLFKLHQHLRAADLSVFNSGYLKKIALQLQQTKKGSNEWMPTTQVTELVMQFKAREDTKGMEKESFSKKVSRVMAELGDVGRSYGKKGTSVAKEAKRFDNIMKGYLVAFSGLFKNQKYSYNATIGMMVAGEATIDARKDMFAKNFEGLLRKVKGQDYNTQMKLSLYALEKRKLANPDNKRIFGAKDHLAATISEAKNENVGDIQSVWNEWVGENGSLDVEKIEKSFTPQERKLVDFINIELSKSNERRKHVAKHFEGATAEDIDWYTPVRSRKGKSLSESLESTQESAGGTTIGASNKALQATKAVPIRLDYFSVIKSHVESSIEYEVMMPVFKQLEATEKEMNKSSNHSVTEWSRILFGGLHQDGLIVRHIAASSLQKSKPTELKKLESTVYSNLMKSMLVGAKRFVVDAGINQALTKGIYGMKMIKGKQLRKRFNSGGKISKDTWMTDLMETYNSEQSGRFLGAHTTDGRGVRSGLENKSSYQTKNRSTFQFINDIFRFNLVNRTTDKALGLYYKGSDQPAMEVWRAFFTESFPNFDIGAYMGPNKLDYREENEGEIKDAIALADKMTGVFYNTPSSAAEKTSTIVNKKEGRMGQGAELLLGFKYNERHALQNAVFSLLPNFMTKQGNLNRKDAAKVAFTISTRAVVYTAAQAYLGGFIVNALSPISASDEEREREQKIIPRAFAQFGAFVFLGNKNAYATIAYELAIEGFLAGYAATTNNEYDSLLFSGKPAVSDIGLLGIALEKTMDLTKQATVIIEKHVLGEKLTSADKEILTYQNAMVAMLGMFFGIKWEIAPKISKRMAEVNK